jgi:two-component system nitrogen regulation response regulator GlnG
VSRLLIVDDEPLMPHAFRRGFREPDYTLDIVTSAQDGLAAFDRCRPDVVILDIHLPDSKRLEAFDQFRARDARVPIILVTGHGTTELAIEAMKRGAFEYLLKPLDLPRLRELVAQACVSSQRMREPALVARPETLPENSDALIGQSPAMQEVYKLIGRVAAQNVTVLITGESGTGKELVARALYQHSRRSDRMFRVINCAAIPEALLESELFGHEKGAFTGADRQRVGRFEQCNGGTLFLDEIGDMAPLIQPKILRLVQEQQFERVGGNELIRTDVRMIAATNRNLEEMVAAGDFRSDLYYRLNEFTIALPPLRDRGDDVRLLAEYYVRRHCVETEREPPEIPSETFDAMMAYRWPGNVRELRSVLRRSLLRMRGNVLLPEFLELTPTVEEAAPAAVPTGEAVPDWDAFIRGRIAAGSESLYDEALSAMERHLILRVLEQTGSQRQAARVLGIARETLRTKLRALNIQTGRSVWHEDRPVD